MDLVELEGKSIQGLSVRTTNDRELYSPDGKIGPLWQEFEEFVEVDYKNGNRVYGVYFDYELGVDGEFSVLAGTDQQRVNSLAKLQIVTIQSGKYLVFKAKGDLPQIVLDTWGKVWDYFLSEESEYKRLYTTDFEFYVNENEVEVYIAVK